MSKRSNKTAYEHPRSHGEPMGRAEAVPIARRVTEATGDPLVGGVAVMLHGGSMNTRDIDIYSEDFWATHRRLEAAGIMWDAARREHLIDGVPIHMVDASSLGGPPKRVSTIDGVRVISLADLVRAKLTVGLEVPRRAKDIAHVQSLIESVPLGKDFAGKLPTRLRRPFKELVDSVHGKRCTSVLPLRFVQEGVPKKRRAV